MYDWIRVQWKVSLQTPNACLGSSQPSAECRLGAWHRLLGLDGKCCSCLSLAAWAAEHMDGPVKRHWWSSAAIMRDGFIRAGRPDK